MSTYQQMVKEIVQQCRGNTSEAQRQLRVSWSTVKRWAAGQWPRNANDRARIEEVYKQLST